ncbi:excitatory amino acid transporter-like, partial [Haemaphysalis longicornis]
MSENSLNLCLLGASLGGMTLGWYMREPGVSSRLLLFMAFPAELYVRMLECLVLPVVTSSIVAALGSIDIVLAGHIGLIAMLYFVVATGTASAIGIGLGLALGLPSTPCWNRRRLTQIDGFLDFLRNIFPDNYVEACLYTTATVGRNFTDQDSFETVREHRSNILGLLSVSVMAGCILSVTVSESDVLLNLFVGLSNATVTVSHLASWYSPVGVFFLVATQLAQLRQLDGLLSSIRAFVLASLVGLGAYGLLLLPGLYALVTGQDPRRILRITSSPALKAFRSASRTVSVPDTIEALEEVAGLEPRIVRFVIPVGANVSMSGTALVMSAAAVTLATLDGLELGPEEMLIISVTVVLASLGAASIPNSGVLTVLMILMALEVSSRNISLVLVLDWLVDRLRMTVNIYSDSVGSAIVQQFSRLKPIEDSLDESLVPEQRPLAPRLGKPAPQFPPGSTVEGALHGADREEQLSSMLRPARRRGTLAYVPQPGATPGGWRSHQNRSSSRPSSAPGLASPQPAPSPSSTSSNETRDGKEKRVPVLTTGASTVSPVCFDVTLHANGQTPVRCQEIVDGTSPARSGIVSSGQCLLDVRSPENRPRGQEEAVLPSEGAPSTSENLVHAAASSKTGSRTRRRHRRLRGAT